MKSPHLWQDAAALNCRAHEHQFRKDGVTPYAAHPMRVAFTCMCLFGCSDESVLAGALLHDAIEDATVDYDDVLEQFGKLVADTVAAMSKDMRMLEELREPAYDEQLAAGPWQGRMVKLADVYDNLVECETDAARRKQLLKVERALKLAEGDEQCRQARQVVREFAEQVRASLQQP